jgi:hypothetical protein
MTVLTQLRWINIGGTQQLQRLRKLPEAVDQSTAGELATTTNEAGETVPTEKYVWDWDDELWTKVAI